MSRRFRDPPRLACVLALSLFCLSAPEVELAAETSLPAAGDFSSLPKVTLYDPDPNHLWNRLYAALFARTGPGWETSGMESLDLLLWTQTKHLIGEPSRTHAIRVLDEFLATNGENLIQDPVKRAVMQRDLWALFDWSLRVGRIDDNAVTPKRVRDLQVRVVEVIKRIALTRAQIESLPDNYSATAASTGVSASGRTANPEELSLPADLFQDNGPWVCVGNAEDLAANDHVGGCEARSVFFVFMRLPGGASATREYIRSLSKALPTWLQGRLPEGIPVVPQMPVGTKVALVRQMLLIDNRMELVASHLTESVEVRAYREIAPFGLTLTIRNPKAQAVAEFVLDRPMLFAKSSFGLRKRKDDETDFGFGPGVELTGQDPFESPKDRTGMAPVMSSCIMCHSLPGIYSVNSVERLFNCGSPKYLRALEPSDPSRERRLAIETKRRLYFSNLTDLY